MRSGGRATTSRWWRASTYLFIAGGIGITPMLPMIAEAEAAGADWRLLYGGRHRASMAFLAELARYGTGSPSSRRTRPASSISARVLGTPQPGHAGVLLRARGAARPRWRQAAPDWPSGSLHLERFSAKPQETSEVADESFELVLQQTGVTVTVPPDKSVFDAALEAGANVLGSCMEGVCGTCETEVVEGDVDHRDSVLNEEEQASNEFMMICVSRCKSKRLVLDI